MPEAGTVLQSVCWHENIEGYLGFPSIPMLIFILAISMSQQTFFQYLKLIYSSLAALSFISSDICASISSFDTCVCIWCSEMFGKCKETFLSAKTIGEPSSVI